MKALRIARFLGPVLAIYRRGWTDGHRGMARLEIGTIVLCLVTCAACRYGGEKTGEAEKTPDFSVPPVEKQSPAIVMLSPECQKLVDEIRALEKTIPLLFMELRRPADDINKDMIRVESLCRQFLKGCAGTEADCEVKVALGRMLMSRFARYREELQGQSLTTMEMEDRMTRYQAEVIDLGTATVAECPKNSISSFLAARILAEGYYKTGRYKECRDVGLKLLEDNPTYEIRTGMIDSIAHTYLAESKYEEAVKFLNGIISKHSEDPDYVVYNIRLFDALTGAGDLSGMEELMHLVRTEYPQRTSAVPGGLLRSQYDQWYHTSIFWLGFIRMALGDTDGARQFFKQYAEEIENLRAEAAATGKGIDPVCDIYDHFRARSLLEFLDDYRGKVSELDFDFGDLWATDKKVTLRESRGKVVAILFRRPEDRRSQTFLQEIDRLVKAREKDGLVGVVVSFQAGKPNPQEDALMIQKMREDLAALSVSLPAGFDPDRERQGLVRGLFGTVGTASFTVINRRGEMEWHLADPRDIDRMLAVRVLERLLAEK